MSEPDPQTGLHHPAEGTEQSPGADAVDIGDGHMIEYRNYHGQPAGIIDWHRTAAGKWCCGWVAFRGSPWEQGFQSTKIASWEVVDREPLTLSPSLLCKTCGSHGFIRQGQWVRA